MARLVASIADERGFLYFLAGFLFKAGTYRVAFETGTAIGITDDYLIAGIHLFTVKTVYAEVVRVIEAAFVVCIRDTVVGDFF